MTSTDIIIVSEVTMEKKRFFWKINHFQDIRDSDDLLCIPRFQFELGSSLGLSTKWECYLKPVVRAHGSAKPRSIQIVAKSVKIPTNIKLFVKMAATVDKISTRSIHAITADSERFMLEQHNVYYFPVDSDGTLLIELEFALFKPELNPVTSVADYQEVFAANFRHDMESLYCQKSGDKVAELPTKLISKDGKEYSVCRRVLSARSSVFRAMFESQMKEANDGIVRIDDISSKSLDVLLPFMLTGHLKNFDIFMDPELMEGLAYGAQKYILEDLIECLDLNLHRACTKDNCSRLMGLARKLGMKRAEGKMLQYFKENVMNTEEAITFWREVLCFSEMKME